MSLNYYYTDVACADVVMWDEDGVMYNDTQSIIFVTITVGMGEITGDNWLEFYARMNLVESIMHWPVPIPPERIKEHIGLRTNVNYESRAKWMKRWIGYELDDIMRKAAKECSPLAQS